MCRCETGVRIRRGAIPLSIAGALLAAFAPAGRAQVSPAGSAVDNAAGWRRVAGTTLNLGLAGPATGPVRSVWYSGGGDRLLRGQRRAGFSRQRTSSTGG